ncbi:hypothetical protein [Methanobacterium sp.]|uniref:hypothetical protein n=1 Tax=Methanobacterium sp. TaxID=2164 RepID=UPI003C722079
MTEKTCFVIAPIGEEESDIRRRSDQILKHIIGPAVKECGYTALRADELSEPGMITSQTIQHIVDDPLVIADLTSQNPNVFYELAICHAMKKPLVQIIRKGEKIPFDIASTRIIQVDHHDLDSVEEAKAEIIRQIKAVENDPTLIDNPISMTLDLQTLRQSGDPEQRSIADIVSVISELRLDISKIESSINSDRTVSRELMNVLVNRNIETEGIKDSIKDILNDLSKSKNLTDEEKAKINELAFKLSNYDRNALNTFYEPITIKGLFK